MMKLTSLLQLVDKSQQVGNCDNLQQVCGVFCLGISFQEMKDQCFAIISQTNVTSVGRTNHRAISYKYKNRWACVHVSVDNDRFQNVEINIVNKVIFISIHHNSL